MSSEDVPDSTDWLATPLSGFAAVEAALRCKVCKDFFKTPMTTSCCHTFCSLCIRRAISNDGKCPLCRASEQESKLRSNWSMEETVDAFVSARPTAIRLARDTNTTTESSKRKAEQDAAEELGDRQPKRLRSSARLSRTRADPADTSLAEDTVEIKDSESDDDYIPEPQDGLVPCPICKSRMKEWQVFKHLEACPGPTPSKSGESSRCHLQQELRQPHKPADRLPTLNYSMLKDKDLRKRLADMGISNQGPRQLLERRHREWITLWNANCDAARPKKKTELLHDLDTWERTQGGRAPVAGKAALNAAIIKDKDFDGAAWAIKHGDSFKDLIASARRSKSEAQQKHAAAATSKEHPMKDTPANDDNPVGTSITPPQQREGERTMGSNAGQLAAHSDTLSPVSGHVPSHPDHPT
ncbi:hypothetical protein B0I35DRAFT_345051 [Stachybotrys elegans]|uniref:Postreplication repair E3 ubiquitin-protein ligase RAD18 n=1 Tax=Stachybotrys elegans TaxID=80388 RepID=A0A8K0WWW3_9HYPO|nr:hypothetical protein B0I35DRAFT_345051 [Stachybotrys elegans]